MFTRFFNWLTSRKVVFVLLWILHVVIVVCLTIALYAINRRYHLETDLLERRKGHQGERGVASVQMGEMADHVDEHRTPVAPRLRPALDAGSEACRPQVGHRLPGRRDGQVAGHSRRHAAGDARDHSSDDSAHLRPV